ncbi:MAG: chorismate mutase [Candidatus Cloacimonadaceae bacterium]|nr:chorismate mutase [Candidatus Cloacimonadaceae bacterium]
MSLSTIRANIDLVDDQIIELLQKRMQLAKAAQGHKTSIEDLAREEQILTRLMAKSTAELSADFIRQFYGLIFSASKELQRRD